MTATADAVSAAPASARVIRVLIADDEPVMREVLAELIGLERSMDLVAQASDAEEAVRLACTHLPDVALLDVRMPGGGGTAAVQGITECSPATRMIALSAYGDRSSIVQMLRAGAVGYVLKGSAADEVVAAITGAMRGEAALSGAAAAEMIRELCSLLSRSEAVAQQLAEMDRTKSELIQVLGHELLTPTTLIQGAALTLFNSFEHIDAQTRKRLASSVTTAADRLRDLSVSTTALASLAGTPELKTTPTALHELAVKCAETSYAPDRVAVTFGDEHVRAVIDKQLADHALTGIIRNALQFSEDPAVVEVTVKAEDHAAIIEVADRGPGIPAEVVRHMFEPFHQGDSSTTRAHGGLGIGLHLARRVMDAHGGRIRVEDRPGGGTIFSMEFPRA